MCISCQLYKGNMNYSRSGFSCSHLLIHRLVEEGMVDFIYNKHLTYQMWTLTCIFFISFWLGSFLLCLKGKAKPSMSSLIVYQKWSTRRFLWGTGPLRIKEAKRWQLVGENEMVLSKYLFSFSQNRVLPLQVYKVKITLSDSKFLLFLKTRVI